MPTTVPGAPRALPKLAATIATALTAALLLLTALPPAGAEAKTKWLCKPGERPNPCKGSMETTVFRPGGGETVKTPIAPRGQRPVDCFYVYPTVSGQPTTNADKSIDPEQIAIAHNQAARFSLDCKVYAPVYRQATIAAISDPDNVDADIFAKGYGDVLAAWKTYLRRYNDGRGVVLIGHSQGTGMLNRLLSEEIERSREQRRRLISAILLGGNVTVKKGNRGVGGTFKRTPLCRSAKQTGCVIAFSTFNEPPPADALFGRTTGPFATVPDGADPNDYKVACTNPAALAGGSGKVRTIARSETFPGAIGAGISIMYGGPAPTADTPWLVPSGRYKAKCDYTDGASSLLIAPIGDAKVLTPSPLPSWGLHLLDANVALGNLVWIVAKQGKRYVKRH
jgi:Protein of unknown function (DUF3089)